MRKRRMAARARRRCAAAAVVAAGLVLAGCSGEADAGAVGFDDAQSATISIAGDGTFVDPGTTAAAAGRWVGSGFLVSADGLAVTASDVVMGATALTVRVGGDESAQVAATVLGASECLGVAVVQLDDGEYPFLAWRSRGTTNDLAVHAAGYPTDGAGAFALAAGTVSNDDMPLVAPWASIAHAIEHDASLGAGGTGGALIDDEGRVAGVVHVGDGPPDVAVHRDVVRDAFDTLAAGEPVASIGVNARGWTSEDGSASGVWVQSVQPGSAAATAGVQPGDLITSLGGAAVGADGTLGDYCSTLRERGPAEPLDIEVYRTATDEQLAGQIDGTALQVVSTAVKTRSGNFTTVTDESGLLKVDVPVEWGQVDGAGFTDGSGNRWYSVVAAPNLERYRGSLTEPGMQVAATASGGSAGDLIVSLSGGFDQQCSPVDSFQPYDDGVYTGAYSRWQCDGTLAIVVSVRNARGNNIAVIAQLRSPFDQQQTLQRILSTYQLGR